MTITATEAAFPGPDEIEGFWAWDKMHAPRPITPLSGDLITTPLAVGFTEAQAEFDSPLAVTNRTVNYYLYSSFHPLADAAEIEDRLTRYRATLDRLVPTVGQRWETEWKPAIVARHAEDRATDYAALTDEQLLASLDDHQQHMTDQWRVHGRINFVLVASAQFCDLYNEIVQPDDPTEAYQALQGFHTRSVDASRGMWQLSRQVRASASLSQLFASTDPANLAAALDGCEDGPAFKAALEAFLEEFGWRSDAVYDVADVTWREEPSIPLGAVASYLGLDDDADPQLLFERAVHTREELLAKARSLLAGDPERLARFDTLYEAARHNLPVTEDHAFWIDQMGVALFRRFVLELGRRVAANGSIASADDVFYLRKDELVDALRHGTDRRELARARRAEMAAMAAVTPPPVLGTPPPPAEDPFMDALRVRLLGITPPDTSPQDPNVLKGVSGSPGTVTGPARVVRSLAEAAKLQDGDIMVCEMTLPPWVPLFNIVSGVVTDTGGVLSHCAIVAREFGLPAVVGTQVGTVVLQDGWTITVDGTKGTVRIDARS